MKVLLVGGLGFIGRRFIRKYSNFHEVIVYSRHKDILAIPYLLNKVIFEEGELYENKIFDILKKHRPDVVIHLAALTGLKKCNEDPETAFKTNVYGTFNVITACSTIKCKLIFISSREVYGETIHDESKEEDPTNPNNVYGITKMLGEILVKQENQKHGLDYTILRLTNVYGPEGDQYGSQVIIKDAITKHKITMLGGNQRLNYVYVDDVVEVINLVLDNKKSSGEIFNVGSKNTMTIEDFTKEVSKIVGTNLAIEYLPMREAETINFKPSIDKLEKILGYTPKTLIEDGIKKTIQWYLEN
ncbi:MAG: NAD(P)-dependent oxidoreductase [Thaumarchaeota archaeon]|nr:NAD(P)-dependent oxidoreductase [Nitrososphaerota archaeon]